MKEAGLEDAGEDFSEDKLAEAFREAGVKIPEAKVEPSK